MTIAMPIDIYENHLKQRFPCRLYLPQNATGPVPVVANIHGFGGHSDSVCFKSSIAAITAMGSAVFTFDMNPVHRHQNNPNNITVDTRDLTPQYAIQAMHCALKFLAKKPEVNAKKIALNPVSFGAFVAVYYAAHANGLEERLIDDDIVPVQALLMQSPVFDPLAALANKLTLPKKLKLIAASLLHTRLTHEVVGTRQTINRDLIRQCKALDAFTQAAPHITCPVLIVQGTKDPLATVETTERFYNQLGQSPVKQRELIDGAGHMLEDVAALEAVTQERWARLSHDKQNLCKLGYLRDNFMAATKADTAIAYARDFLLTKVFPELKAA